MASGRHADPQQAHPTVRVHRSECDPPELGSQPVEAPGVGDALVDEDVVRARLDEGLPSGFGARVVEPGAGQADGIVGYQLRLRVVVRERIDRDHDPVVGTGEAVEALDRRIGGHSPCEIGLLGLRTGDDVERCLAHDMRERALAVGLVQLDEGRKRKSEDDHDSGGQDGARGGDALSRELPRRVETGRGQDGQRPEDGHEEAQLQRGQRGCPERQVAEAEQGRQGECPRRPAAHRERHQDQVCDADAAAESRAVHGHVPRQGKERPGTVAEAEVVEERPLAGVGLRVPEIRVRPEQAVRRREHRIAGLELRPQIPGQRRQQRDREEAAGRGEAAQRPAARGDQDQQRERRGGDQRERLGRERQAGEQASERERAGGGILRVPDHPSERQHHEEGGSELDVGGCRLPGDRGRHREDRRREQRRSARRDLDAEAVGREREQNAEPEVDQLGRDLVADCQAVPEQQLERARVVSHVLAAQVHERPGVQIALRQVEVVPEGVVLDLRPQRPDQRERACRREQHQRRALDRPCWKTRAGKPAWAVQRGQDHPHHGYRDQQSGSEQVERGEAQGEQVEDARAGAHRHEERLEVAVRVRQQAPQRGAVAPGRHEDRRGRGDAAQPAQRFASDRGIRQGPVHERSQPVGGGRPEVGHRHRDRPRGSERREGGSAACGAETAIHWLAPLSWHPRQRSNRTSTGRHR